jgi:hypothetical protein
MRLYANLPLTRYDPNPEGEPHVLVINRAQPMPLEGTGRLALTVVHHYRILEDSTTPGSWLVVTAGYFYTLWARDGPEFIAYHWHPDQQSWATFPHLHLESHAQVGHKSLEAAHLPTGLVSLTDVLQLAIRELGVLPLRNDWERELATARPAFTTRRPR